jgi:hypothetical protein
LQQHHRGGGDNDPSEETHRITSVMVAAAQNLWRSLYRNGPLNLNSGGGGDALKLAHAADTPMRLGALCERETIEARARGWADRDASIFLTLQEERAEVQVRLPPT